MEEKAANIQAKVSLLLEELEPQKIYFYSQIQEMLKPLGINHTILDSLYYFDIDCRENVIRGIHIIQLLKTHTTGESHENQK
jgi:cellobiose-specific phosphotransferase system component IIB